MFKRISHCIIKQSTLQHQKRLFTTRVHSPTSQRWMYMTGMTLIATGGCYFGWTYFNQYSNTLNNERYIPLKVMEKEQISPDSYRLRLSVAATEDKPFPVPSCVYIKDDSIQVMRPYTPINPDPYKDGFIDLIVKRYQNGSISRMLTDLQPNDKAYVRGPMVEEYEYKENSFDEVGMIAGGTGITPMYQLIRHILENPNDKDTQIWLIYGNKTLNDILLKSELDQLQKRYSDRFKVKYVLENPPSDNDNYEEGYITKEMIEEMMLNKPRKKIFVSGPDKMLASISGERAKDYSQGKLSGILFQINLSSDKIWKFQ
ncbi:uncharacterized protein BX663DRAFT_518837 [Cokeromyces recurvatus]|uniref:uncharacterized protein n=1 Tax=Cokeromyces recurvatus TaxID=90255 RepID=UPI00221E386D|nr:uncharacterized protein BX663DRAFT_522335 [Cokeromyces recurvatus]XP_051380155.1 uncharacterized protein BX663DRAFT_518837 [Cokeromyces recurvatus]KAI7899114.1 hypothetical protein BX663DRAFT_522335 [Cokeromyces recurvatus]KAI7900170.1 hypothetical protein BX663DRAFT_518837 [Cokeromyces recurvatus]